MQILRLWEKNRLILVAKDVSSRYSRRNRTEFGKVADYITELAHSHVGNYMVFFPSYRYMEAVEQLLDERYDGSFRWQMQTSRMTEKEREKFLELFEEKREQSFVGLCVLGGIFSEGIDLKAERLEGAIIVGTGLPMVCSEQEILMQYFAEQGENGYDYAYQYPGMNKVLQAAGRVIRTAEDRGVILLLDDRFLRQELRSCSAGMDRIWSGDPGNGRRVAETFLGETIAWTKILVQEWGKESPA